MWDGVSPYHRYAFTLSGISPFARPGTGNAVVKVNSYAHDEAGITTEDEKLVTMMTEKRLRKGEGLAAGMNGYPQVNVTGVPDAPVALLCWGSTGSVCREIAGQLGVRVIRPVVLSPFPAEALNKALSGVGRLIAVEENATGQLASLAMQHGIRVHQKILRYDGRPFTHEDLLERVRGVL